MSTNKPKRRSPFVNLTLDGEVPAPKAPTEATGGIPSVPGSASGGMPEGPKERVIEEVSYLDMMNGKVLSDKSSDDQAAAEDDVIQEVSYLDVLEKRRGVACPECGHPMRGHGRVVTKTVQIPGGVVRYQKCPNADCGYTFTTTERIAR